MPVIDPQGLFEGDRLSACSDKAKLYWPFLYCASNGYARLEVNINQIRRKCFSGFMNPPSDAEIIQVLEEYADNFLVLLYEQGGRQWVQFDTHKKYLPRHKSKKDEESPSPIIEQVKEFEEGYINWKSAKSLNLQLVRKISENFGKIREKCHGIGIGIGIGIGVGEGIGNDDSYFLETEENLQENGMNAVKQIPIICKTILGVYADMSPMNTSMLKALEAEHKGSAVANIFTQWAKEHKYDEIKKPIASFLKESDDLFAVSSSSSILSGNSENGRKVGREISYISNQEINLDKKQVASVVAAMAEEDYSEEEVYTVFRTFYIGINRENAGEVSFAPKKFSEVVGNLLYANRRKKQELSSEKIAMDAARDKMQEEVSEKVSAILKKKQEEKNSLEDDFA